MRTRLSTFLSSWQLSDRDRRRLLAALTAVVCLSHVVGILMTSGLNGRMIQGDANGYFAYLPSVVLDGDLDLRNQFERLRPERGDRPFGGTDSDAANPFSVGSAILWLPGYLVGCVLDWALWMLGASVRPIGCGPGAALGAAAWCIVLTGLGADATRRLVQQTIGVEYGLSSTVMIWLGTPALYYTLIAPLYSHAIAWFAVSLMIWSAWVASQRESGWARWGAVGLLSGLVLAIRQQDAPTLLIPLSLLVVSARSAQGRGRGAGAFMAWTVGALLGVLPQAVTSLWINGSLLPIGDVTLSTPTLSNVAAILLSTGYQGWISWTPIVLPSILGLGLLARRSNPRDVRVLAIAGLAAIVAMVAIDVLHPFGAGAAFGGRRYVSTAPLLTLGLAAILALPVRRVSPRWKLALPALMVWNLWLLASYESLTTFHGVYPTLHEAARYAVGLGAP